MPTFDGGDDLVGIGGPNERCGVVYAHFCIEHVHGHHRHVATPRDPATPRRGESVYAFWPRTILGGAASAWRIEAERQRRRGRAVLNPRNRMVRIGIGQAAVYAAVWAAFGWPAMIFFAAQGLIAVLELETVNYIEHYGLARQATEGGRFEPVAARHATSMKALSFRPVTRA